MPIALPARRADLYFFSRAMRSRSPRVFAMLTTLLHIYLHVVVDIMYISWIYTSCGDRTNATWPARRRTRTRTRRRRPVVARVGPRDDSAAQHPWTGKGRWDIE